MAATQPAQAPVKPVSSTRSYLVWGVLAIFAVIATSASITLGIGASQGTFSLARFSAPPPPPPPQPLIQKPEVTEFEVARLRDAIRALSEERDRLNSRVETLEHSVGDITASIATVKEHTPLPAAPVKDSQPEATPVSIPEPDAPPPVATAAKEEEVPQPVAVKAIPVVEPAVTKASAHKAAADEPPAWHKSAKKRTAHRHPQEAAASRPARPHAHAAKARTKPLQISPVRTASTGKRTQVASVLPHANIADSAATKTEFGLDLGGEISMDGLRALWANIKGNHGKLLNDFHPIVRVREGIKPGTVELHLVAGPVPDAGSATRLCANLHHAGVACQTTEYDGQRLSLR